MRAEKRVGYQATASYETLNAVNQSTRNIWLVFHGMGYLSRYFLRYFNSLDPTANYIIAPQAPSKYYLDDQYRNVGSCWLTRVDTAEEVKNVLAYVDAVWEAEGDKLEDRRLIILGYSQGVSIATRWMASREVQCDRLLLHSGGIPKELTQKDFDYLNPDCRVTYLYGDHDQYITQARMTEEQLKATDLFAQRLKVDVFEGRHEVNTAFLEKVANEL
jgi:predicted esterase